MTGTQSLDGTWSFPICRLDFHVSVQPDSQPYAFSPKERSFSLVYLKEGTAILQVNQKRFAVQSPFLLTLEDGDEAAVELSNGLNGSLVLFLPEVINDRFGSRELLLSPPEKESTLQQDRFLLLPFFEKNATWPGMLELPLPLQSVMSQHFAKLTTQLATQPPLWPCRSRSYLLEILLLVNQFYQNPAKPGSPFVSLPAERDVLEELILFLHGHYREDLRLEDLASRFATNRTTLNERFGSRYGTTVMAYLLNLRLRLASTLLRDTTLPSREILDRCGFLNQAHFSRIFKRFSLMTPSGYRKAYSWFDKPNG